MATAKETLFSDLAVDRVQQLETPTKCRILNGFWPHLKLSPKSFIEEEYTDFLWYIGMTVQDLSGHQDDISAQGFESMISIIQMLRDAPSESQRNIIASLRRSYLNTANAAIGRFVRLAVQLWLCLHVYSQDIRAIGSIKPRDSRICWGLNEPLDQLIASQFLDNPGRIFPSVTSQIDVYQHRIVLLNHYNDPQSILPKSISREAIWTLDLLLPYGDSATGKLLQGSRITLGVPLEGRQAYDLEDFTHWKSNLVQLLDILHGPPEGLFRSLRDTRNMSQWATIWIFVFGIFILTLAFGSLTTAYSILQYRVTVNFMSYLLPSLASREPGRYQDSATSGGQFMVAVLFRDASLGPRKPVTTDGGHQLPAGYGSLHPV
ncbi:hypothetical protein BDV19DRAFT_388961 [Aspergillus venezuelensis]